MAAQMISQIVIHINFLICGTKIFWTYNQCANVTGNNTFVLYKHHHKAKIDHHGILKGTVQLK